MSIILLCHHLPLAEQGKAAELNPLRVGRRAAALRLQIPQAAMESQLLPRGLRSHFSKMNALAGDSVCPF